MGVFTNLSPDHIGPDEHADFAEYLFWKRALFRRCRVGVFNNDDPHVGKIMQGLSCRAVTYGIGCPADVRADADFALTRAGGRLGAAFTVDGEAFGYPTVFASDEAFAAFLEQAREKSAFQADVQVTRGDRLLILSTCAYSYETERLLVVAKIIE